MAAALIICAINVAALSTNEVTTSSGDLNLNSSSGIINIWATNTRAVGTLYLNGSNGINLNGNGGGISISNTLNPVTNAAYSLGDLTHAWGSLYAYNISTVAGGDLSLRPGNSILAYPTGNQFVVQGQTQGANQETDMFVRVPTNSRYAFLGFLNSTGNLWFYNGYDQSSNLYYLQDNYGGQTALSLASGGALTLNPKTTIDLKASADTDDYLQVSTVADIPYIDVIGGSALRLRAASIDLYSTQYVQIRNSTGNSNNWIDVGTNPQNSMSLYSIGTITLQGSGDTTNTVKEDVSSVARLYPAVNNSATLGFAGRLWATIYAKTSVTSDAFYNGNPDVLIREVEKADGLAKQFIPREMVASCPDSSVMVDVEMHNETDTWVGTRPELETECWMRVGEAQWDNTSHVTETYDGDVITSDGLSVRDVAAENSALRQVMLDNALATEEQLTTAVTAARQAQQIRLGGALRV